MKKLIKWLLYFFGVGIIYLNISLYYQPKFEIIDGQMINKDVYHQLKFLKKVLKDGAGKEMQQLFPEGFIFINVLYGLSWCELISDIDHNSTLYKEGLDAINFSLKEMNSAYGKSFFDEELPLRYGAFYQGWTTYLLGKKLAIQTLETRSFGEVDKFRSNCEEIKLALKKSENPYLESYSGLAWPADMLMCIASLSLYNKLFTLKYENVVEKWLDDIKKRLDKSQLIPHAVEADSGYPLIDARGNSQSLMLNFLMDIDADFAWEQFKKYKVLFKDCRFGLPGIRHYPKGTTGYGDIDSGPVIFGIGGAASIVGQRAFAIQKDWLTYIGLRNSIESFGVSFTISSKKNYVFGQLPMADAFICWSNSIEKSKNQVSVNTNWRLGFQILSLLLSLTIVFILNKIGGLCFCNSKKISN